ISAFEILAHPGEGRSGLFAVYELFENVRWGLSDCSQPIHEVYGDRARRRILACWVYGMIHKARNDFLHGNPVTHETLIVPQSKPHLLQFAPILYRLALTGFLRLEWQGDPPHFKGDSTEYEAWFSFRHTQSDFEAGLATILVTEEQRRAQRGGRYRGWRD